VEAGAWGGSARLSNGLMQLVAVDDVAATGGERTCLSDPHAGYIGTEPEGGELTPGDVARIGATDFDPWFATLPQGAGP
jgi:hypothetical protein